MNGMNGMNGHAVPPVLWQEARNADGRVYYYNTITKATQWTKPEDLMSPAEVGFSMSCTIPILTALACPCEPAVEGIYC
jgi:hypothetical protein